MKRITVVSAVAAIFLAACETPTEETKPIDGRLINMGGFSYTTESESGITTRDGTFQFQEGEMVTFYLGDTEIGRARAKSELTLFEMLDETHSLPRTALSLRQQLRSYQPIRGERFPETPYGSTYTGGNPVGIHWAANVVRLLLALDDDNDLSNGVDASAEDWPEKLKGHAIDFNMPLDEFANLYANKSLKTLIHEQSLPVTLSLSEPLAQLYASENLAIAGKVRSQSSNESEEQTTYTWNDKGLIETKHIDWDTYDRTYLYTYNSSGKVQNYSYTNDTGKDGIFEWRWTYDYSYNTYDERTQSQTQYFQNNDAETSTRNTQYTYSYLDDKVFQSSSRSSSDSNGDGNTDAYRGSNYIYDDRFNLTARITPGFDLDGNVTTEIASRWVYSYDSKGNYIGRENQSSFDEDGVPGNISSGRDIAYEGDTATIRDRTRSGSYWDTDFTYDSQGRIIERVNYYHNDGSGPRTHLRSTEDPLLQSIQTATFSYSNDGRFDVCEEISRDTDGNISQYNIYDINWNDNGIVSAEYRYGSDVEALTTESAIEVTYGEEGEWISATLWETEEYTYSYHTLDNAMAHIITEVLEIEVDDFTTEFEYCGS